MSDTHTTEKPASIVDTLFDTALAWVDVGLAQGKVALEGTSNALAKTAKALETVREKLAEKPAA